MRSIIFIFPVLIGILLVTGCAKEETSPYTYSNESSIFSDEEDTRFREILFMLKPYAIIEGQVKYLVVDSIFNVKVQINDQPWGQFESLGLNAANFETVEYDNYLLTSSSVKYPVIAPFQTSKDTLTLAGEYADLLNDFLTLEPGSYICEIESFEILLLDGSIKQIDTYIVESLEVEQDVASAYLGEFDVLINN